MYLLELPSELLLNIADKLQPRPLFHLSRTCHVLHALLATHLKHQFAKNTNSVLHWATKRGRHEFLSRALPLCAAATPTSHLASGLLLRAAWGGHLECVRLLLDHGVDPNQHFFGRSPLDGAVRAGSIELVKLLLEAGADRNKRAKVRGLTSMELAQKRGNQEMRDLMAEHLNQGNEM